MPLNLKKFVFSPFAENTYVIWEEESKEAVIIDPGCSNENEEEKLSVFISENKIKPKYLINTHCHLDHIFGNYFVKNTYGTEYYAPEEDLFLIDKSVEQAKAFMVDIKPSPKPDDFLYDGFVLQLNGINNEFLFTPGHTPGEFCIYFPDDKICLTGDVLFKQGIGRTDLWGGDYDTLMTSIKSRLLSLPDDVVIYPGHGESSTISYEKKNNPFLQ